MLIRSIRLVNVKRRSKLDFKIGLFSNTVPTNRDSVISTVKSRKSYASGAILKIVHIYDVLVSVEKKTFLKSVCIFR